MKFGYSRNTIAANIRAEVFDKELWSLIAPPQTMIKFITSSMLNARNMYYLMERNVSEKVNSRGGNLKSIHVFKGKRKYRMTKENAHELMSKILYDKECKVLFKVNIRNKTFDFVVESK